MIGGVRSSSSSSISGGMVSVISSGGVVSRLVVLLVRLVMLAVVVRTVVKQQLHHAVAINRLREGQRRAPIIRLVMHVGVLLQEVCGDVVEAVVHGKVQRRPTVVLR